MYLNGFRGIESDLLGFSGIWKEVRSFSGFLGILRDSKECWGIWRDSRGLKEFEGILKGFEGFYGIFREIKFVWLCLNYAAMHKFCACSFIGQN